MFCGQDLLWKFLKVVCRREGGGRTGIYRPLGGRDSSAFKLHLLNIDEYICIVTDMLTQRLSDTGLHNDTNGTMICSQ